MATGLKVDDAEIEELALQRGRDLWNALEHRQPSMLERRWWDDRLLDIAMADESVKVQMFRFVDVLPRLKTNEAVTRHLREYFEETRKHLPWAVELVRFGVEHIRPGSLLSKALAYNARMNAVRMAKRFIAGSDLSEVLSTTEELRKRGQAFTLDLLGEAVVSDVEAQAYQQAYLNLIAGLTDQVDHWPDNLRLDQAVGRNLPRVNVSLKLSALHSQFRPIDATGTAKAVKQRLRPILRSAIEHGAYVHIDMEHYAYKDLTLKIFREVLLEKEFRDWPDCGIVLQAYLKDAEQDLQNLLRWVDERGTPVWIRLVKGAYWDYETVTAAARGWPIPVFQQKWESDACFERMTRTLLEHHEQLHPALGTHNLRSICHAMACAQALDVPKSAVEFQMLHGMAEEQAELLTERGYRVRIYAPFGELIPGMAYLVRRLLENTSNDSFLRHSYAEDTDIEELLRNPAAMAAESTASAPPKMPEFTNEPPSDFSREDVRDAFQHALDDVADELGETYPLFINGRSEETAETMESRNPSRKDVVVGRIHAGSADDVVTAVEAARRAFSQWSRMDVNYRAEYLELVASELRERRFELAAWQVYECGKPWAEADGDVAEAIDFCRYYAMQVRHLFDPRECDVPGEENRLTFRARGVTAVIAPWNFPLAILTGMTAAAIATGNTVVMKPAEQSSVVAAKLMQVFQSVGIPDGVVNYLPGEGEVVGAELVGHPDVSMIAFTGSRTVGLQIFEQAAATDDRRNFVKQVIAEMGGKNALIIDDDADLDEAVQGTLYSAFGYAGQKCSACSRVVVLNEVHDEFVKRLVEAAKSIQVGSADDPGTYVPPVIDEEARQKIKEYIEIGKEEATLALGVDVKSKAAKGYYVGPHIFTDVAPDARIAQEEIFGPVLSVIRAEDLTEAITIANGTDYALTGGIYSRSPKNLERAARELIAGNIYLNRPITGALVERQPFGGYRLSGTGNKAGGPDYLKQFVVPVNVTENTLRRGFAPQDGVDEDA